jgi:putative membrane protein
MNFLIKLTIAAIAVLATGYLLPGVEILDFWIAAVIAALLALFNSSAKPLFRVLTVPVTIYSLGLFLLAINAVLLLFIDVIVDEFIIRGFGWTMVFSFILSTIVSFFENKTRLKSNRE